MENCLFPQVAKTGNNLLRRQGAAAGTGDHTGEENGLSPLRHQLVAGVIPRLPAGNRRRFQQKEGSAVLHPDKSGFPRRVVPLDGYLPFSVPGEDKLVA